MNAQRPATCYDCGCTIPQPADGAITTGYGQTKCGNVICYGCCAERDKEEMRETGRIVLYLTGHELTNWPGSLRLSVRRRSTGNHNIAGTRTDVWFQGPDGLEWHGTQYGRDSQLCHCKRLRTAPLGVPSTPTATVTTDPTGTL